MSVIDSLEFAENVESNRVALKNALIRRNLPYTNFTMNGIVDSAIANLKDNAPAPEPEPSAEEKLLSEIRDLLKNK